MSFPVPVIGLVGPLLIVSSAEFSDFDKQAEN